jgi:hypothetical protein
MKDNINSMRKYIRLTKLFAKCLSQKKTTQIQIIQRTHKSQQLEN